MKSHLNVSAKLELQTQERMYESRLLHLENGEKVVCIFYTEILIMHNQNHDIKITKDYGFISTFYVFSVLTEMRQQEVRFAHLGGESSQMWGSKFLYTYKYNRRIMYNCELSTDSDLIEFIILLLPI